MSRALFHLGLADFLQRVRSHSFLIVVALMIYATYVILPNKDADYVAGVVMGTHRGVYNSAWIGTVYGIVISMLASLFAFYLIKNTIHRDRQSLVGRIIATTPTSKFIYLLGKWLSNLAVLTALMGVIMLVGIGMQLWRGEDTAVNLIQLILPMWLIGFPVMGLVAAVAILFETIPFLRGGFGNVVYYFLWMFVVISTTESMVHDANNFLVPEHDLLGISHSISDIQHLIKANDASYAGGFTIGSSQFGEELKIWVWEGLDWSSEMVLARLGWLTLSILIVVASVLPFDRFDSAKADNRKEQPAWIKRILARVGIGGETAVAETRIQTTNQKQIRLTPITQRRNSFRFGQVLLAESQLMLKGLPWWWYGVAFALILVGLFSTPTAQPDLLLPLSWLWPVLLWSQMGIREAQHNTDKLLFSTPNPLLRQLPALWLSGVLLALIMASGIIVRLFIVGDWMQVGALFIGAMFVPSLALALGVISGTSRLFEIVYLLLWYLAIDGEVAVDFMFQLPEAFALGIPLRFLIITVVLMMTAVSVRWLRINHQ